MSNEFYHSAKGTHWTKRKHKYINKIGDRYIYPSEHDRNMRLDRADDKVWDNVHTADKRTLDKLVSKRIKESKKYYEAKGVESRKQMEDPKMWQHRDKQSLGKWRMSRMGINGSDRVFDDVREASINNNARHLIQAINKKAKNKDVDNNDKVAEKLSKLAKKYNKQYGKDSYKDKTNHTSLKPTRIKSKGQKAVEAILKRFK